MAISNTSSTPVKLPSTNADGLRQWYGRDEATHGRGGEFSDGVGHQHVSEFYLSYTDVALGLTDTNVYVLDFNQIFPSTAVIDKVEFITGTAWAAGGDVLLNFGFVKSNEAVPGTYTIVDADGLVNSLADDQIDTAGQVTVIDGPTATYAGALMGVQAGIGFDSLLCTYWETTAPTSGTGYLRIYWRDKAFTS